MTRPAEGLLDTSAVIALPALDEADALPGHPLISAITLAELAAGPLATDDPHERARRQAVLQQAEHDFHALPVYTANPDDFGGIPGLAVHEVIPARPPDATRPSSRH